MSVDRARYLLRRIKAREVATGRAMDKPSATWAEADEALRALSEADDPPTLFALPPRPAEDIFERLRQGFDVDVP